jgi:predicted transcriptional regulator
MSVVSIRLNETEEQMLNKLTSYYEEDKSRLIKHSLKELYEDLIDREEIEKFELKESKGQVAFKTSDEVFKELF